MATMVTGQKFRATLLLCSILLSLQASAVEGEINTIGGPKVYDIEVTNQNITDNRAGFTFDDPFALNNQQYLARATCASPMTNEPVYYTAKASLFQAGQTAGYLKLNDYMDVKIDIYIAGPNPQTRAVPFDNVSNNNPGNNCVPPDTQLFPFESGSRGSVTFMITKPIINGVSLRGTEIAQLFGRLGSRSTAMGSNPMAVIRINSGIFTVPDKCIVNSGAPITVDFGTIPSSGSALNGSNYGQNIPIQVQCDGGSFATGNLNIRLGIQQANPASFNSEYLGTTGAVDRSNLGIMLKDASGNLVAANTFYNVPGFANNRGTWNLYAAPIAKAGTDVLEGDFQASATVVAEFQ